MTEVVDVTGIEPVTPCLQSSEIKSMLLVRLALFCVSVNVLGSNSTAIGPKLDPSFRGTQTIKKTFERL
jgi:hypothetical protein